MEEEEEVVVAEGEEQGRLRLMMTEEGFWDRPIDVSVSATAAEDEESDCVSSGSDGRTERGKDISKGRWMDWNRYDTFREPVLFGVGN